MTTLILAALCLFGLALLLVAWPPPRPAWLRKSMADVGGANRAALKPYLGQQNQPAQIAVSFLGQGASAPLNNVGDPGGLWLTITRQNVGKYTIKTVDPWVAMHGF